MVCAPTLKPDVLNVATPDTFSAPVPSVVAPSLNVTVPVAVPVAGATTLTVAVNVTGCPNTDGFSEEANAVELEPAPTVCVNAVETLADRLAFPP